MSFDYTALITDRTDADVAALKVLEAKHMSQWTEAEAEAFNAAALRGAYNYTDLNRVSVCMEDLVARLNGLGYAVPGYKRVEIAHAGPSRLPEGYTELEYIESTGTQYVDTEFSVTPENSKKLQLVVVAAFLSTDGEFNAMGTGNGVSNAVCVGLNFAKATYGDGIGAAATEMTYTAGTKAVFDLNREQGTFSVSGLGEIAASVKETTAAANMYLFAFNAGVGAAGTPWYCAARLYSCQIYSDDALTRDFVPCEAPDGTVGLWDAVNGKFYGNAGTGVFTGGAKLDPYTWYASDSPTDEDMEVYRGNVAALRAVVAVFADTPATPEDMVKLTWREANDVEKILVAVDQLIQNLQRSWYYSGEVYAGEV